MESRLHKAFKHLEKEGGVLVILCFSVQESEALFVEFERNNVEWKDGTKCTQLETKYERYGNQTCYVVKENFHFKFELMYGTIEKFMEKAKEKYKFKNHIIVTANAFLTNPNLFGHGTS